MVEATTGSLETYPVTHATARNTILGLEKQVLWTWVHLVGNAEGWRSPMYLKVASSRSKLQHGPRYTSTLVLGQGKVLLTKEHALGFCKALGTTEASGYETVFIHPGSVLSLNQEPAFESLNNDIFGAELHNVQQDLKLYSSNNYTTLQSNNAF
ncbi:hypothetical protein QYF61_017177 [Mycteria americana]|uniref:Uncharacterized protein n=1 Tax=Mycteria americana TaxID=33587 RepID=A0AAN7MZ59_MYCAM|nr:hypothetical protein QYF61_017177 [Mycteria americana]